MSKIVVVGTLAAVAGRRRELVATLQAHKERCLRDEKGTLSFDIMTSIDDDSNVFVHEVYENAAEFEAHLKGSSFEQWKQDSSGLVAEFSIHKASLVD